MTAVDSVWSGKGTRKPILCRNKNNLERASAPFRVIDNPNKEKQNIKLEARQGVAVEYLNDITKKEQT